MFYMKMKDPAPLASLNDLQRFEFEGIEALAELAKMAMCMLQHVFND